MKKNSDPHFHISMIPVSQIDGSRNIRSSTNELSIKKLAESIKVHGLLQPIGVKADGPGRYILIFGSRRLKAIKHLGNKEIYARVFKGDNLELLDLLENIQREELTIRDEALGIYHLIESGLCKQSELVISLGKTKSYISRSNRLGEIIEKFSDQVSFTKLPRTVYWELLDTPELIARAEFEEWNQHQARTEVLLYKKGGLDNEGFENSAKKTAAGKQSKDYKIFSNDELGNFEPILIREDGFTVQEFTYSVESDLDRELVTKKMMDLLSALENCIGRVNNIRDQATDDIPTKLLPSAEENPYVG